MSIILLGTSNTSIDKPYMLLTISYTEMNMITKIKRGLKSFLFLKHSKASCKLISNFFNQHADL